ncbi:hypothetical protein [Microbispora sp. NPDC049125]|uniref:hypothetical protein n=1 Tax=Microbispora sp. NPDC049125 TaxID=3154929 RepID=UPI00346733A2
MSNSAYRRAKVVIGVGVMSLAAACGSVHAGAGTQSGTADTKAVPRLDTIQTFVFPLDQYQVTRAQQAQLTNAMRASIGACMQRFGFANRLKEKVPVGVDPFPRDRRYLFIDPALTAKYGYAGAPQSDDTDKPDDAAKKSASMSVDEQSLLTGQGQQAIRGMPVPSEGCTGEGRRAVSANTSDNDEQLVMKIDSNAYDLSMKAPEVGEANKAWSACMQRAGYSYTNPEQAWEDPRWGPRRDGGALTEEEIATSTADMKCKVEVNYLGVRAQAEADAQRQLIAQNLPALQRFQKNLQVKLGNARKLVGE